MTPVLVFPKNSGGVFFISNQPFAEITNFECEAGHYCNGHTSVCRSRPPGDHHLQIAREVGVTEPAVFYYFKNKQSLFSVILEQASDVYYQCLDRLDHAGCTAFECLEALIRIHFAIVAEKPEQMRILLRTGPARLEDPENICTKIYREVRSI